MSHTSQPEPAGVRVTAQPAEERLVPLLPVMTWAAVTVTVTDPGVRSRIASAVTVATATWRAAVRCARTPRSPAAWARAGSSEAAATGCSAASHAPGGCRQDQESQAAVNRPARLAAACSRSGGNGSSEASEVAAADGWGLAVAAGRAVVL